jgi:AcrR family transcriptional regulator
LPVPPTRPALRARYDERRQEVIAKAAEAIAQRGFHATSVPDLVEATGLTSGGLYHYIGSKDELLGAICEDLMAPLLDEVRTIDGPPEERLREFVRVWLRHVERHRHHVLVFQQERNVLEQGPQWRRVRQQRKQFEGLLAQLLADPSFRFADRDLALLALLGMVNHTALWLRPRGRLTAEQVADGYVDLLLGSST